MTVPYEHDEDTIVHGSLTVDSGINVGTVNAGLYPLSTYVTGKILETTMIYLKPSTIGDDKEGTIQMPPFCCGAEWYQAVNHNVGDVGSFPAGFTTDTARTSNSTPSTPTFHRYEDNVGVFGSYVYSGQPDPTFVGGMVVQAAQYKNDPPINGGHEEGKLGTRLLLAYTPKGTSEAAVGAMIDDDGTFAVAKNFRHVGNNTESTVGFFGAAAVGQQEVRTTGDNTPANIVEKVNDLITALLHLGLIKPKS